MTSTDSRPNIILIHCHDLGTWLSCYGMDSVPSPHLQRFADESVVFDAAFSTAPLCTPARSSMFTGLLPHQNGLMGLTHSGWRYHDDVTTLPEMLGRLGYRTALIGLQHEDFDARVLGYDEVHGLGFLPRALEVARRADWWLGQRNPGDAPFFATIGMWEVHRPWPDEDYDPADPARVVVPGYLPDNSDTREDISRFYGSIRQMDEAVGVILTALDASPHADNTLVIFTTDHGVAFPRAKSTLYDSGVNVSFIVRPPRSWTMPAGRRADLVSHLDIAPTLIDVAGGSPGEELEGESLLPILHAADRTADRELVLEKTFHDRYDPIRALRTTSAKYIRHYIDGPQLSLPIDLEESLTRRGMGDEHMRPRPREELYLIGEDPDELRDLAEDPAFSDLKTSLSERLDSHLRRTNDPLLEGPVPPPRAPSRGDVSISSL